MTTTAQLPSGQQEISLFDGHKLTADLYIPAFGLTPNSSYVPTALLDATGHIVVDDYLRVKGTMEVWAVGDVSNHEPAQFKVTDTQSAHLARNIAAILSNKALLPYRKDTRMLRLVFGLELGLAG